MVTAKRRRISTPRVLIHVLFILMSVSFLVPLLSILSISFSRERDIINFGYRLFPIHLSTTAYQYILNNPITILVSYKVTIIMSVAGTLLYLAIATMCAYPLSRMDFKYRNVITFYLFFTMLFGGGLVPYYILMTQYLHLKDTYLALILPMLANVWFIFLLRTFFMQIPRAIIESAVIDGASELKIYLRMILPLSKPALATIGLLQLLNCWNSWYNALLFIDKPSLYPLQYLLQVMLQNISSIQQMAAQGHIDQKLLLNLPTESIRMAMCVLTIGPILFVFPFFQKYFTKGLTVGAIKG